MRKQSLCFGLFLAMCLTGCDAFHHHSFSSLWTYDESAHWHKATCGHQEESERGDHVFADLETPSTFEERGYVTHTCTVCGYSYVDSYSESKAHEFSSEWKYDEYTHWHLCTDGGYGQLKGDRSSHVFETTVKEPDYQNQGYSTHTCTVCGYSYIDSYTDVLSHSYSFEWSFDENCHWHACLDAGYEGLSKDKTEHDFELITDVGPTELADGVGHQECRTCGFVSSEKVEIHATGTAEKLSFAYYDCSDGRRRYCVSAVEETTPGNVVIPKYHNNILVEGIAPWGFSAENSAYSTVENPRKWTGEITSIVIPDSVDWIGAGAFSGCKSLVSINVPSRLSSIESATFRGCKSLASITIPDSVVSIGSDAFSGCESLASIDIPDGVTSIGDRAFSSCKSLTSIVIPEGVTSITCISNCPSLVSVTLPSSAKTIKDFRYCDSLVSINIPNGVTSISSYSFEHCSSLLSIDIPDSVTSIGSNVLGYCSSLTAVSIGSGVEKIGENFAQSCPSLSFIDVDPDNTYYHSDAGILYNSIHQTALYCPVSNPETSLRIPDGTVSIRSNAFSGCTSLRSVYIPDSVTSIGLGAFSGCTSLETMRLSCTKEENGGFMNYIFGLKYPYETPPPVKTIVLGEACQKVDKSAFYNCSLLTSIAIPDSVTSIDQGAFSHCSALSSIDIPDSVTEIAKWAFSGCSSLASITIPRGVRSLDERVFEDCDSLASISIPDSVTSISQQAFYRCTALTSLTIPDSVTSIGPDIFAGCSSLKALSLPFVGGGTSKTSGKDSSVFGYLFGSWSFGNSNFMAKFVTIESEDYYYEGETISARYIYPSSLQEVTIRGGDIPKRAFDGFYTLKAIAIPETATSIGQYAFRDCSRLTSVFIPDSVTSFGGGCFAGCDSIKTLRLSHLERKSLGFVRYLWCTNGQDGNTSDDMNSYEAYYSPRALKEIILSEACKAIPDNAFGKCTKLTSIFIPNSVTSIGQKAFFRCESLASISIPSSVVSIGYGAFALCESLTSISIPSHTTTIGAEIFYGCTSLKQLTLPFTEQKEQGFINHLFGLYLSGQSKSPLTSVTLTPGCSSISSYAFACCQSLSSIIIPESVTQIGQYAFYICPASFAVYYCGTQESWSHVTRGNSRLSSNVYMYSETQPSEGGKYWHYVNGTPSVWW